MSDPELDPEEVQAILGMLRKPGSVRSEVTERDFARPRRLARERLEDLRHALAETLPPIERTLRSLLDPLGIELVSVSETDVDKSFPAEEGPLAALTFRVAGQPGWILWEIEAAIGAIETVLGSKSPGEVTTRPLSAIEASVLEQLLIPFAQHLGAVSGQSVTDFAVSTTRSQLGSWRDAGPEADPHRIEIELGLSHGEQSSTLRAWMPALSRPNAVEEVEPRAEVPAQLNGVPVEVRARLEGCEVALAELLSIEIGDVIPLDATCHDPVLLSIEDEPFAYGRLGSHRGHLAVRIEHNERMNLS